MKTTIQQLALAFTLAIVFTSQLNARIITLSNQTFPIVAQYTTLQAAHDGAINGDTIYVYPSLTPYSAITISKKIAIIGTGFSLVNDYSDYSKISGTFIFDAGAEGSLISSLIGTFDVNIKVARITVQRCKINTIVVGNNLSNSNVNIVNCCLYSERSTQISIGENSLVGIYNNIFMKTYETHKIQIGLKGSAMIQNNFFMRADKSWWQYPNSYVECSSAADVFILNNICENPGSWGLSTGTLFKNNITIDANDVNYFVDFANGNYHLKDNSPAKAAGTDGKDLGIYGGDYPFIDDGTPNLPTVYYMLVPTSAKQSDGLPVVVKAKTNK